MKNPRRKETMSREEVKGDAKNGETSQPEEEEAQRRRVGCNPHRRRELQCRRRKCKKMKYIRSLHVITLTEDDAELVVDKVQDRGEDVVRATEAQREEIMVKLVESMILYKGCIFLQCNKLQCNNQKRHNNPLRRRNKRKQWR
jgi:hypothetical protein